MDSFELTRLDANTFEQLVNMLVMQTLGNGSTGFGPGADGGRDGWFEGAADYPSPAERWQGTWYIQSKFHKPHLSKDPQKWLISQVKAELDLYSDANLDREWPDNWIIATNVDPSGKPNVGSFDAIRELVHSYRPELADRTHVWGGTKILSLLAQSPATSSYFADFITAGHVIRSLYESINVTSNKSAVVRDSIVTAFDQFAHTKLDQAGHDADTRPGIHHLYVDIPHQDEWQDFEGYVARDLARASALNHSKPYPIVDNVDWSSWAQAAARARVWFIIGGPGQGKSTSTQFFCQVHRAAAILESSSVSVTHSQRQSALAIRTRALSDGIWPSSPRLPVSMELREFAKWYGERTDDQTRRVINYWSHVCGKSIGQEVSVGLLSDMVKTGRWIFVFDGLDEVPGDVKDAVAEEITYFVDNFLVGADCDALVVCTSRPQGYSGQFSALSHNRVELVKLSPGQALACAKPVLSIDRSIQEAEKSYRVLQEAIQAPAVQEIMTSPLQAHIMAVVVRNGHRPPERKWQLFNNFYDVMRKREANRTLPNPALAALLSSGDKLIKSLHSRLGFDLHAKAEKSEGATTSISRSELKEIVLDVVGTLQEENIDETVDVLMEATTERLVLVNTPDNGDYVRFDIRPLQEFFAAEHISSSSDFSTLSEKLFLLSSDSHWREVVHFYISALVENDRKGELSIATSVLEKANVEINGDESRELSLRLAIGGVQAGRLLSEGVLEQDRRVRSLLRPVISALAGCTDAHSLIGRVASPHSRSWLVDVLLTALRERSECDSVGAALLLPIVLLDGDSRAAEAMSLLAERTASTRSFVLLSWADRFESASWLTLPRWVRQFVTDQLASADWMDLEGAVGAAVKILVGRRAPISNDYSMDEEDILSSLGVALSLTEYDPRGYSGPIRTESLFGAVDVKIYSSSIMNTLSNVEAYKFDRLRNLGGFFEGAIDLVMYHSHVDNGARDRFLSWISADRTRINALPAGISELIDPKKRFVIQQGGEIDSTLLVVKDVGCSRHLSVKTGPRKIDWKGLAQNEAWLISHSLIYNNSSHLNIDFADFFYRSDCCDIFEDILSKGWFDISLLAVASTLNSRRDTKNCMSVLVHRAKIIDPQPNSSITESEFVISESDREVFLPFVLADVLSKALAKASSRSSRRSGHQLFSQGAADGFGLTQDNLREIAVGDCSDKDIKASAWLLMAIAEHEVGLRLAAVEAAIALNPDWSKWWIAVGSMLALSDGVMVGSQSEWALASSILEKVRDDLKTRKIAEPLLRRWRERTGSPVLSSASTLKWH